MPNQHDNVTRVIVPELQLKSYKSILRYHYQEKRSTKLFSCDWEEIIQNTALKCSADFLFDKKSVFEKTVFV